jgi:hypothetical protein
MNTVTAERDRTILKRLIGDDNILPERFYDSEKDISSSGNVSVQSDLPCFIEDAEIHFFGVKVDSTIKFVLFVVKSHGLPPLLWLIVLW